MTMHDEINRTRPAIDRLNEAIRDNPLAAGLIGAGFAWLLLGHKGLDALSGAAKQAAGKTVSAASSAGVAAASGARKVGESVKSASAAASDAASAIVDQVASIVPELPASNADRPTAFASEFDSRLGEQLQSAASSGREYAAIVQSRLSESLDRQPLLLGAIGLAIGAGIASTFATTAAENEWFGERGEQARDALQGLAGEARDRAQQALSDVQEEAERQGLTLDGAQKTANSLAEKAKSVAGAAVESVKQRSNVRD